MMGYRDRSWCPATCANATCDRNITPTVQRRAEAWWGGPNPPFWYDAVLPEGCPDKLPVMEEA